MNNQNLMNYPKFLKNEPLGEDLFEGKSQEAIADSIVSILENNTTQMIGIDGSWGSGKSNLVGIIDKKLKGKDFHFFTYDAWGHQEDAPRRAILEELIEFLIGADIRKFESEKWKNNLKSLLAKSKETTIKTKPSLSVGIVLSVLAVVLTPILNIVTDDITDHLYRALFVGVPLMILLLVYGWKIGSILFKNRKNKEKTVFSQALEELFVIYQRDQIENTSFEIVSEEEPSVRKFREWIKAIDKDLDKSRLVIVIDNMDRLPSIKVQELWSSIHVFFAETSYKKISVIVPFDREHIRTAFKAEDGENCYGDDFINKSFGVVYRVPLPILSDWKSFFEKKWVEAFGEQGSDYIKVVHVYDVINDRITPREIIAFVNEIVSVKQTERSQIPDRYLALFVIGKSDILKSPLKEIIEPTYLKGLSFLYEKDEEMPKYIAALTYQISPVNALQIVYTKQLTNALSNGDLEKVQLISKSPEFIDVLLKIIPNLFNVEKAITTLNGVDAIAFKNEIKKNEIWDSLAEKSSEIEFEGQKIKEYQKILFINVTDKKKYAMRILNAMRNPFVGFVSTDYSESVDELARISEKHGFNVPIFDFLRVKETTPEDFVVFVEQELDDYSKYKISCPSNLIDDHLSKIKLQDLNTFSVVSFLNRKTYPLTKYVDTLKNYTPQTFSDLNLFSAITQRLKEAVDKPIKLDVADSQIYTFFTSLAPDNDFYYDLLAMRIAKLNGFQNSYTPPFDTLLQSEDKNSVEKVASLIEYYINYGDVLLGLTEMGHFPLYRKIAQKLTEKSYGMQRCSLVSVMKKFQMICETGMIDPHVLVRKLSVWDVNSINSKNIKECASAYFLENALSVDCQLSKHVESQAVEFLSGLSQDDWQIAFRNINSYEIKVALLLNFKWSTNSHNAFKSVLCEIAKGELPIPSKKHWDDVVGSITNSGRKQIATFNDVRDIFCTGNKMTVALFHFFGDWLFKYSSIDKKDESLRTILPTFLLKDPKSLEVIHQYKEKLPAIYKKAGDEAEDFKMAILELLKESANTKINELRDVLSIEIPEDATEEIGVSE
jgi:hypothetical protein